MSDSREVNFKKCVGTLNTALGALRDAVEALKREATLSPLDELRWTKAIPHSHAPGVYLFFDREERLLYVGKAERPLGFEVWSKFSRGEGDAVRWKEGDPNQDQPAYIATIPIPDEFRYLAPALEGLLIREFQPPQNTLRKRR